MPISVLGAIMAPELAEGLNLLSDVPLEVSNRPKWLDIFFSEGSVPVLDAGFFSLVVQGQGRDPMKTTTTKEKIDRLTTRSEAGSAESRRRTPCRARAVRSHAHLRATLCGQLPPSIQLKKRQVSAWLAGFEATPALSFETNTLLGNT